MQRDLVIRASQGDRDAFAVLARGAIDRLHRTARLILRDDDRAADAVQEALISAWIHIRAVRDPDRFDAWLYRLVVHACYREARRGRRRQVLEIHVVPIGGQSPDPAIGLAARDEVERAFRKLTPEQRAVIVVHHYLGLSDAEAASVLDVPIGTVKSRLSRANTALRAAVEADARAGVPARESVA